MSLPFFGKNNPASSVSKPADSLPLPSKIPHQKESLESLWRLVQVMLVNLEFEDVVGKVVNSVLGELGYLQLGYRIIVLGLINEQKGVVERVAISQTEEAKKAVALSPVPFKDIIIPLSEEENFCIKAMKTQQMLKTGDWYDFLRPVYTAEQAKALQQVIGIKTSLIYPLSFQGRSIGFLIFSIIKDDSEVKEDERDLLSGFTDLVGLAVQNSMLFTSLKRTTLQLQEANRRLKELDKLKDDFVSIASHELRTPMTAIKSYLWMAINRGDIKLSEKMSRYLSRAYISTDRLINLVNDMLNVSRIEAGRIEIRPKAFNILELVDEVGAEILPKLNEKGIKFNILKVQIPEIFADPDKVHQVLLNLVGNASKFTPQEGVITVSFFSDGKVVETSVKDSGVGMVKEDLVRLFQKFGRLDNSYTAAATTGGTGLGLFISRSLVELMQGKIWATSEGLGKGTTFTFSLPAATPAVLAQAEKYARKVVDGEAKMLEPASF